LGAPGRCTDNDFLPQRWQGRCQAPLGVPARIPLGFTLPAVLRQVAACQCPGPPCGRLPKWQSPARGWNPEAKSP